MLRGVVEDSAHVVWCCRVQGSCCVVLFDVFVDGLGDCCSHPVRGDEQVPREIVVLFFWQLLRLGCLHYSYWDACSVVQCLRAVRGSAAVPERDPHSFAPVSCTAAGASVGADKA